MQKQSFMRADEVAQELGISKSHAYKVIHELNEELQPAMDLSRDKNAEEMKWSPLEMGAAKQAHGA